MSKFNTAPLRRGLVVAGLLLVAPGGVLAQTAPAVPGASTASKSAPKVKAAAGKPDATPSTGSDGGLGRRVDQLEEQIVDMQVVVGTLESLARQGASAAPAAPRYTGPAAGAGALSASDTARLDGIETQIRALTAQLEQLAEQVRAQGQRRSDAIPPPPVAPLRGQPATLDPAAGGFGSTSVAAGEAGDPIGGLIAGNPQRTAAVGNGSGPVAGTPLPPVGGGGPGFGSPITAGDADANPKQLYETAYGYLLQQDYGAAETAFDDFLRKYPNDSLSGNAQYWLGESYYVRGQYKQAASAFLKGYQTYGRSAKAPDSLLKLAMSLDKLGQKDAACSSYGELTTRFPSAPPHIKNRAQSERQRLGCG